MLTAASHRRPRGCRRSFSVVALLTTTVLVIASVAAVAAARSYRPDALIRTTSDSSWVGNGVYNTTGHDQTRAVKVRQGRMVEFEIKAQNDGAADSFKVHGTAGTASFRTTYWSRGDDVTTKVVNGSFTFRNVPSGRAQTITARVQVARGATVGSTRTLRVTLTSLHRATRQDAVQAKVTVGRKSVIDAYLADLPPWSEFSPPVDPHNSLESESDGPVMDQGKRYYCHTQTYSFGDTPDKLVTFTPDSNILWLGSLLQGKGYTQGIGSLAELPIRQRTPLVISTNLLTGDTTRTVQKPTVATVQQATADLVSTAADRDVEVASNVSFKQEEMYSLDQAALSLGLSADYMGAEVRNQLDYSRSLEQHTIAAYFVENAFTVSMVLPQTPGALFSDDFTQAMLDQQVALGRIGPDNLPVYVDSITYGRVLMFSMTSSASSQEISDTLSAVYNGPSFGGSVDLTAEQKALLQSSTIRVATIGGASADALALIQSGEIGSYFAGGTPSLTSFRPISYTIRNLGDSSLAKVGDTLSYDIKTCERSPLAWDVTVTFRKAVVGSVDDGLWDYTWELRSFNFYAQGLNHQTNSDTGVAAEVRANTCDQAAAVAGWAGGRCVFYANPPGIEGGHTWQPAEGTNGDWHITYRFDNRGAGGTGVWPYDSLRLMASIEEYDASSDNDWSSGQSVLLKGDEMLRGDDTSLFTMTGSNGNWTVFVTITKEPVDTL